MIFEIIYLLIFALAIITFVILEVINARRVFTIVVDGVLYENVRFEHSLFTNTVRIHTDIHTVLIVRYHTLEVGPSTWKKDL